MKVSSIMTKKVVTINMDTTLKTICKIFEDKKFHHLFVIENDKLCGVISDRDLFRALSPFLKTAAEQNRDLATLTKHAHQIMSRKPITIKTEASSKDAVQLMLQKNISCLPVLSSDGKIEGVVTWKDLLVAYSKQIDDNS